MGRTAIRGLTFYILILPLLVMIVLGLFRFRFAVVFWRRAYIVGLVYVAVVVGRLLYIVLT